MSNYHVYAAGLEQNGISLGYYVKYRKDFSGLQDDVSWQITYQDVDDDDVVQFEFPLASGTVRGYPDLIGGVCRERCRQILDLLCQDVV